MKLFAVLFISVISLQAQGAGQCVANGNCKPGDPGVECYLQTHDCYPDPDCNAPGCPGFKCADLYYCYQYDEPCGSYNCYYCTDCAIAGNCSPGTHKALSLLLSTFIPDSLKILHEKAERMSGLHGFLGNRNVACRRVIKEVRYYSWRKV